MSNICIPQGWVSCMCLSLPCQNDKVHEVALIYQWTLDYSFASQPLNDLSNAFFFFSSSSFNFTWMSEWTRADTLPGMKQQRLESTYFMKVMLSRDRRVSTAAKMSAWRAKEWFLLSDSRLRGTTEHIINVTALVVFSTALGKKRQLTALCFIPSVCQIDTFEHIRLCLTDWDLSYCTQRKADPPPSRKINK